MTAKERKLIGKRLPMVDGVEKVTGRAVYSVDFLLPGMLHAKLLRSPFPHARILSINTEKAWQVPGVRAVVTAQDAPNSRFGIGLRDERFFASDEVYYVGDEVAAVVAIDEETAARAVKQIEVQYQPLPAVFDPQEAVRPEAPLARGDTQSNIAYHTELRRGDVEEGFRQAAVICEETYFLPHQYQCYLEPHAAVAQWKNGRLTIWTAHQSPRQLDKVISEAFELPPGGFQFIQTQVGGGFGGKTHMRVALLAALLARIVGAPVRVSLTREEDFIASMPRVPMIIHLKMGVDQNGIITAKQTYILADNGAYSASAVGVLEVAAQYVDTLYRFKNIYTTGDLVYTNKMGTSAFRGYGNVQMHFAVESMMDTLAEKLGIDPAEMRLRNATRKGDVTVHGRRIGSCGLSDAIRQALQETGWHSKRGKMRASGRGIGMACAVHGSGTTRLSPVGAAVLVRIDGDGRVRIATSEGDIGQGAKTVLAMIAAEELGVPYERIWVDALDTDVTNFGVGAISSRVTVLGGNGVRAAAAAARQRLIEAAARQWQCDPAQVVYSAGTLVNPKTEEAMDIAQAASAYIEMTGGSRVVGEALYTPQGVELPDATKYGNISLAYPFTVDVAEVEVDRQTGRVTVLRLLALHDSGQIINLMAAEGQIEGGLSQGLGYALSEEFIFDEGRLLNPDFTNYRLPTIMDVPDLKVRFLNVEDPNGPFGAKSVGEIAMVAVAPAIANAIYDAVGVRMTRLPITPERMFAALQASNRPG